MVSSLGVSEIGDDVFSNLSTFAKDLRERAVKTFFQAAIPAFFLVWNVPTEITDINAWKSVLVSAGFGAFVAGMSALTSLFSKGKGGNGTASLVVDVVDINEVKVDAPGGDRPRA